MRFDRSDHSDCDHCPFLGHTKVWGEGPVDAKIAVFGEAPGRDEDEQGRPFVGPAGGVLSGCLAEAEIGRANTWVSNTICCRPPNNDISSPEAVEAIERCRPGLTAEMAFLRSKALKVAIPTGNTSLKAFTGETGITTKRGSVYDQDGLYVVPTYHPSYIMRGQWNQKPILVADLQKAKEVSADGWSPPAEHFITEPTIAEVELFCRAAVEDGRRIALDIETTGIKPHRSEIVCVGLATDTERALCIPFLSQHGRHYWTNGDQNRAEVALRSVLQNCPIIIQNAVFDAPYLAVKGFPIRHIEDDTLLLHATIDSDLPHTLGFITSVYGSTPYWKERFKKREGGILALDDHTLRTYNLRDCVVLHQVTPPMFQDAIDDGLVETYRHRMDLLPVVNRMASQGLLLDRLALRTWKKELEHDKLDLDQRLRSMTGVPYSFSWTNDDDLRLLIHGYVAPKFGKALEATSKRNERAGHFLNKDKDESAQRIWNSKAYQKDRATLDVYHDTKQLWTADLPTGRVTGKTRRPAVDDQALLSLQLKAQNRAALIRKFRKPKPQHADELREIDHFLTFLRLYREWAATTKLLSTYTNFQPDPDGRVRGSFSLSAARTGRLASREPNFQNQPPASRKIFVAAPGHTYIERDYSNLELRIMAYIAGDEQSIADFENGLNVHTENCRRMWHIDEDDPNWDRCRHATKTYVFGRNYGGSLRGIYEKVVMQVPELGLTYAQFAEADEAYRQAHPQEAAWREQQSETVYHKMVSYDAFGGRRVYRGQRSEAVREGLNHPIQGTAARIIGNAMIDLEQHLPPNAYIVNQVHDSLLIECPDDRATEALEVSRLTMEAPVAIAGQHRSFPTDAKIGRCWGQLEAAE